MRKVLIVGYFWPYRRGSKRVIGLAKYLPEFNWQPIILTGPLQRKAPSEFRVIETNFRCILGSLVRLFGFNHRRDISDQLQRRIEKKSSKTKSFFRRIYWLIAEFTAYPDENKGWKPFAVEAGSKILEEEKIDAIISVWPVTSHIVAKELKKKYQIPWIADLPDLWSQNQDYHYNVLRKIIDKRLERRTLALTDIITTVTKPWAEGLKRVHLGKTVFSIPHGFDPRAVLDKKSDLTSEFTISYTGQIYHKKQDPKKILIALKELIDEKKIDSNRIKVRFYGHVKTWLADEIEKMGLEDIVEQYGELPKDKIILKQRESQILLLLNWDDSKEKGVCPAKIYEYLAIQRPILATGGSGGDVVEEILSETRAGVYAPSVDDIKKGLKDFYSDYQERGKVSFPGNMKEINKFSHREMAKKFAQILDKLR
jgi:hypothetical protein